MKISVKTLDNKAAGDRTISDDVFGLKEIRQDILHRAVIWQRNNAQAGTHKTKGITEISGTGKKPFRQKGTGRARAGSLRAAQHRGGATIFGPVVRSHATSFPKKLRALALKTALSAKSKEGKLIVLDAAKPKTHKTKDMTKLLLAHGVSSALIVDGAELNDNFVRATGNIPHIDVLPVTGINVYDILRHDHLILSSDAIDALEARLV